MLTLNCWTLWKILGFGQYRVFQLLHKSALFHHKMNNDRFQLLKYAHHDIQKIYVRHLLKSQQADFGQRRILIWLQKMWNYHHLKFFMLRINFIRINHYFFVNGYRYYSIYKVNNGFTNYSLFRKRYLFIDRFPCYYRQNKPILNQLFQ